MKISTATKAVETIHDKGWAAENLRKDPWIIELDADTRSEIARYLELIKKGEAPSLSATAPRWRKLAERVADEIEYGRGFVVLRGLPADGQDNELAPFLLGIAEPLGTPVSQTVDGKLISFIRDLGLDSSKPTVRGHQTSASLPFHCDRADTIGLLCIRPAKTGGLSLVASAIEVHNILQKERPDLLEQLYQPLPQDRRGEELPGQKPWLQMPIFGWHEGRFISRYIRRFIESASRFADAPPLTSLQREALDYVDRILERPEVTLQLDFMPGDLQLLNNCTIWHSRTAFEDHADPAIGRLLLRLWLAPKNSRALPSWFYPLYDRLEAGAVRGGVPQR